MRSCLTSPIREVAARWEPLATRKTDSELLALADAAEPNPRVVSAVAAARQLKVESTGPSRPRRPTMVPERRRVRTTAPGGSPPTAQAARIGRFMTPEMLAQMELARKKMQFLADKGVAMLVEPSSRATAALLRPVGKRARHAPLAALGQGPGRTQSLVYDKDAPKIAPQIVLSKEHYNRLVRMCEAGEKLKMAVELKVAVPRRGPDVVQHRRRDPRHRSEGRAGHAGRAHGLVAQRHRRDRQRRRRLGRHGGGAHPQGTRPEAAANRSGSPSGAARKKGSWARARSSSEHFGRSPANNMFGGPAAGRATPAARRTATARVRAQGRRPSRAKAEYDKFSAYFNLDNGTGKIRGVYMQGNEAVRPIFRKWLPPFREMGATTLTISNTGGTDHQSFDGIGLPGFQFIQDEIEYDTPDPPFQPGRLRPHPGRRHEAGLGDHGGLHLQRRHDRSEAAPESRRLQPRPPMRRLVRPGQPPYAKFTPRTRPAPPFPSLAKAVLSGSLWG